MLPGPAQSWTTVVLCTLPFMANHGTGRGEEGDRRTHGPALLRLPETIQHWPFLRLAPSAGSDCLERTHSDSHAPDWGSLLMMMIYNYNYKCVCVYNVYVRICVSLYN